MLTKDELKNFNEHTKRKLTTGCIEWTGSKNSKGYGVVNLRRLGGTKRAHRIAHEHHIGPIPKGHVILHSCDNRCCVNPQHLSTGTQQENMDDMVAKGRSSSTAQLNNNHAGKGVRAEGKKFKSYSDAGRSLGISRKTVRARVVSGRSGYSKL